MLFNGEKTVSGFLLRGGSYKKCTYHIPHIYSIMWLTSVRIYSYIQYTYVLSCCTFAHTRTVSVQYILKPEYLGNAKCLIEHNNSLYDRKNLECRNKNLKTPWSFIANNNGGFKTTIIHLYTTMAKHYQRLWLQLAYYMYKSYYNYSICGRFLLSQTNRYFQLLLQIGLIFFKSIFWIFVFVFDLTYKTGWLNLYSMLQCIYV